MATIGGVGVGLVILATIWIISLFMCVAFSRSQGAISYAGIAAVLVALLLTIILWFFPRGEDLDQLDYVIYDDMFIPRVTLISVSGFILLVGLVMLLLTHGFEPQTARVLSKQKTY